MSERPPISPRSPRAALEPEQVPPPPRRSDRARNPFVIVGNAIITLLLFAMIGAGASGFIYTVALTGTTGERSEVAGALGCSEGTLSSRLTRGRRLLAARLKRRGVHLSVGAVAALCTGRSVALAGVPAIRPVA